MFTALSKS
jgi:hypothetical protein